MFKFPKIQIPNLNFRAVEEKSYEWFLLPIKAWISEQKSPKCRNVVAELSGATLPKMENFFRIQTNLGPYLATALQKWSCKIIIVNYNDYEHFWKIVKNCLHGINCYGCAPAGNFRRFHKKLEFWILRFDKFLRNKMSTLNPHYYKAIKLFKS